MLSQRVPLELRPIIDGPADGHILFFIQGWPDDASIWDPDVAALKARYRCVRVNLPGSGGVPSARGGYTTDQVVDALSRCIRGVTASLPVTLIAHDWGAFWAYIVHHRHPELVARLVGLDVGGHIKPKPTELALIAAYQGWLASAFLLGGTSGDWMTRTMARLLGAPGRPHTIQHAMNFPYRNSVQELFTGGIGQHTRRYRPTVPLLYFYGTRKPMQFQSQRWLDHVRSTGGKVVALDWGHWVQLHPTFLPTLTEWLDQTASSAAPRA